METTKTPWHILAAELLRLSDKQYKIDFEKGTVTPMIQTDVAIQALNEDGQYFYGSGLWAEIIAHIPLLAFLTPLFQLKKKLTAEL